MGWRSQAKKNGLTRRDLDRRRWFAAEKTQKAVFFFVLLINSNLCRRGIYNAAQKRL